MAVSKTDIKKAAMEERILEKARGMFNETGVEYVGMRELAVALGMRIGNLTYYFATKDALVDRLAQGLAEENNRTIVPVKEMTMRTFFWMLEGVFHNHVKYRCLMLSFVHLMERNPLMAKRYSKTQARRNETWMTNIHALKAGKFLEPRSQADVDHLVSSIAFIARFWISEAAISYKDVDEKTQIRHYLNMIARVFLPYTTEKGRREIKTWIS